MRRSIPPTGIRPPRRSTGLRVSCNDSRNLASAAFGIETVGVTGDPEVRFDPVVDQPGDVAGGEFGIQIALQFGFKPLSHRERVGAKRRVRGVALVLHSAQRTLHGG